MVLALFILKIGMAHACASHDLAKELSASASTVQIDHSDVTVDKKLTSDNDSPGPAKHAFGSCADCNCHHAAAMLSPVTETSVYKFRTTYFSSATFFNQVAVRSDLRPPIL